MNKNTKRMVDKYGIDLCLQAYNDHMEGNGANTIGLELNIHTNTADAIINAGRNLIKERWKLTVSI